MVAESDNHEVAKILIDAGSNLNAHTYTKDTPHHSVVRYEQTDVLEFLIRVGANINAQDLYGQIALHRASWKKRNAAMKLLITSGADQRIGDNKGCTADDMFRLASLTYHI